jgi:hypothetical protein
MANTKHPMRETLLEWAGAFCFGMGIAAMGIFIVHYFKLACP